MPSNLTWPEARELALAGTRVRQEAWETEWLSFGLALWFIGQENEAQRVVQAEDFSTEEFLSRTWTTEPYAEPDPCDRRPPRPVFDPPSLSVTAELVGDDLTIVPLLGTGTFGGYRLIYLVNGVQVGVGAATAAGAYPITVEAVVSGTFIVSVRAESALPLPRWSATAVADVLIICPGLPTGDVVFQITGAEYKAWSGAGTWRMHLTVTGGEIHTQGGGGGSSIVRSDSSPVDASSPLACGFSHTFSPFGVTTSYFGFPSGGLVIPGSFSCAVTINLGMSGGLYYAGVTVAFASGFFDSGATPGTGYGTTPFSVGGYDIPMQSRWTPGYAGFSGYSNTYEFAIDLERL